MGGRTGLRLRTVGVVRACLPKSNIMNRGEGVWWDGDETDPSFHVLSCTSDLSHGNFPGSFLLLGRAVSGTFLTPDLWAGTSRGRHKLKRW
jgi:hypothetical protein